MKSKQAPPSFPPLTQYQFVAGPYEAPDVQIGATVRDLFHGDVVVTGLTRGLIRWPGFETRGLHRGPMPILFGDLVRLWPRSRK